MRHATPGCATGLLTLLFIIAAPAARAQHQEGAANQALNDTFLLLFNGPVYLSSRLPMLMAAQPPGAGMELSRPSEISLGVSARSDIYGQFNDVTYGTEFLQLRDDTPDVVPVPGLGIHGRIGISDDVDAGVRLDFFPSLSQRLQGIDISVGHFIVGANARYRLLRAHRARPELLLGVGLGYTRGGMSVARQQNESFEQSVEDAGTTVGGHYEFTAGPKLEWALTQLQLEARSRWRLGGFHPYLGFGVDFTTGSIASKLEGNLNITVDEVGGQAVPPEMATRSNNDISGTLADEKPTLMALHPIIGLELDLGHLHVTLQGDVMMPLAQRATAQSAEVEEFLDNDEGFYYVRYRQNDSGFRNPAFSAALGFRYDFN